MAKRMVTDFTRCGFPTHERIDDDDQAKPCVYGSPWVNDDTLRTIAKHGGRRTGPKGEALPEDEGGTPKDRSS